MTSLWLASTPEITTDPFEPDARYDEVVVGAGLTGLTIALLFARAGRRVAVLESRSIGALATGKSTAKLSLLQSSQLQKIKAHTYQSVVQAYVDGNLAGQRWLLDYADSRGIAVQRRDAVSYAGTSEGVATVEREYRIAASAGLPVRLTDTTDLPFETFGAVVLPDQAQFDPLDILGALAADLRELGGVIIQGTRVIGVKAEKPARVRTSRGEVFGDHVLLTTGTPMLNRGLYFAKLSAKRSYAASYSLPADATLLPQGMYLSVDAPTRSVRTVPAKDGVTADAGAAGLAADTLIVGGNGHPVGREHDTQRLVDDLHEWTADHFPGAKPTHSWSAQDYETPHRVPFVGYLPRGRGRIYFASGYDKWGMTNAVQAALTLFGDITGDTPPWAKVLHHRVTLPAAIASGLGANAATGWWALKGWAGVLTGPATDDLPLPDEGQGFIARSGLRPTGTSTVDGRTCQVSAVCPHLGGVLTWNTAETSWDCPLHGSRFAPDGTLLEGPTTHDLRT
ncbi:FAD-dependent oxidoreductase [Subtercola boreus]|uniref:FAD-dependent oxidoreductase n=1 Tax=Subtercola boreus TaxID=120213 RepID=A0A3E0WB67_9MICO|nr:FAD-dependent oxidoreductase [Subtercola boreus]RFA20226.1 FAD-dependent oxidoreductase [Subtercola boreus]RFA20378.1 FAD-dependent oxidoreductase [Subtercola boreus]RFA26630.1 FAD-dependent oxidoreductase [Subtercola boreus]